MRRTLIAIAVILLLLVTKPLALVIPPTLLVNSQGFSKAFYDDSGKLMRVSLSSDDKYRIWVPLSQISPALITATLNKEDKHFYFHPGFNPFSLIKAVWATSTTDTKIGASTITMQLARLRYGLYTKSIIGKFWQIVTSVLLEQAFTKSQILEAYLNLAPYGGNIEGIQAASIIYFGKTAAQLSTDESLILRQIPQLPSSRSLKIQANSKKADLPNTAPHLTERLLNNQAQHGLLTQPRILTSIDSSLQQMAQRQVAEYLSRTQRLNINNASVILVDTTTMQVKSYIGSADYLKNDISGFVDGIQARRSPGSALKPFIYALALEQGLIHPGSILKDTAFSRANYNPENFERDYIGPISATDALVRSRNIPAVSLLNQITPAKFLSFLDSVGVKQIKSIDFYGLSIALGGVEVRSDELIKAYAMLANGGVLKDLIFTNDSNASKQQYDSAKQILNPDAARLALEMLATNPRPNSTADSTNNKNRIDIPWKTGTSFAFRDAWAAGIIGQYALVVWVGNFNGQPNPAFVGREAAGPLFFAIADSLKNQKSLYDSWRLPKSSIKKVKVCATSGQLPNRFCKHTRSSWFIPGVSPIDTCLVHRQVFIDKKRNVRTCPSSFIQGTPEVLEFWPSDLATLFRDTGLARKDPPPYAPECQNIKGNGQVPFISSPSASTKYILHAQRDTIPLSAVTDGDSSTAYWFADDTYIGQAPSGQTVFWKANPGVYVLRVVDEQGRANQMVIEITE